MKRLGVDAPRDIDDRGDDGHQEGDEEPVEDNEGAAAGGDRDGVDRDRGDQDRDDRGRGDQDREDWDGDNQG
jgi:hypothetical protein